MGDMQRNTAAMTHLIRVHRRTLHIIVALLMASILVVPTQQVDARANCITKPELCVGLMFREYWLGNDGMHTFGDPIGTTQTHYITGSYFLTHKFERAILEYLPGRPAHMRYRSTPVGQLWHDAFKAQLRPLDQNEELSFQPGHGRCSVVEVNKPAVCGEFLDYYTTHGIQNDAVPHVTRAERLALMGVPLTPVMKWQNGSETRLVQIFSHARLDYLPNNAADNKVVAGDVVVDLLSANIPLPTTPSEPINYLVDTGVQLLDNASLEAWRKVMHKTGYWQVAGNGVYTAVSSFTYLDYFYTIKAGKNMKYIAFTMLVKNQREANQPAVYVDYSYIGLIDTDGNRHPASKMIKYLATPFTPTTIPAGSHFVGQLIFEVPYTVAPAQIEINMANMDAGVSRFEHTIEVRVPPLN